VIASRLGTIPQRESNRINMLNGHLRAQPTFNARLVTAKSDDDVVHVSMAKTGMIRAKKGPQANTGPEAMLAPVLKDVFKKANNFDPKGVQEI
jgi:hypothetical protein